MSFFLQRKAYVLNFVNYVEWLCYIASFVYVIPICDCKKGYKTEVGAISVFFGWMNLILYFRRWVVDVLVTLGYPRDCNEAWVTAWEQDPREGEPFSAK